MKKLVLLSALVFYAFTCFAQTPSIEKVRSLYERAAKNEEACVKLLSLLKPYKARKKPLLYGYKASAVMMMAEHVWNPFSKLSYFNRGKEMLEKAIKADIRNAELRLLRLIAQSNTPSFLGYDDYINEDKKFLRQALTRLNNLNLKSYIIFHLKSSDLFSFKPKFNHSEY